MRMRSFSPTVIIADPSILSGTPVVSGTRIPADAVLAEIRAAKSRFDIFRSYPSLPVDGIDACLSWEKAGRPISKDPRQVPSRSRLDEALGESFPASDPVCSRLNTQDVGQKSASAFRQYAVRNGD